MNKVILSGYYGFDNFGDEAILQVLVDNLKKTESEITVLSYNPKKTAQLHNVKSIFMFNIFDVIKNINTADILISGGGSLLQDVTSIRSLIYYLFILFMGTLCCKKTIIFAQGIGPINNKLMRKLTKWVLKKVNLITVRDEKSQNFLSQMGLESVLVEDPVWGIRLKPLRPKNRVGIQLREWKYMNDEFFLSFVKKVAKDFADKEIYIYSLQDKQDKEICTRFEYYLYLENPKIKTKVITSMNVKEIIESMKNLEYLVAMRYHAVMIGLKYGIKTLAINYDPKVESIAEYAQIPCIGFEESEKLDEYFDKMYNLSFQSILQNSAKKRFLFKIFAELINEK